LTQHTNESPVPTAESRGRVAQDTGLAFAALRHRDFRPYFVTTMLSMMADNIEHVVSYWVIFEIFHSPILAGFAVVSHWLPFLLLSWYFGGLADRFDYRRIIQASQLMYMGVSVAWAILIMTDSLEMWHAAVLLVVHGLAGTLWSPGSQLILHNLVGPEHLQSAVRLNATGRQLGVLLGPAVGGALMLLLGPYVALLVNTLIYLPLTVWLQTVPYAGRRPEGVNARRFSWTTALRTLREGNHIVVSMVCLAGVASFFIGTAFQAQMPEFAHDLGTDGMGYGYAALLAANGAGAVVGGLLLEGKGMLAANARTAVLLATLWCITLGAFSAVSIYPLALVLLFIAGILNLSFMSMTQTLVQLNAPAALRGRFIGLYIMCAQGLKTFSGITVGVVGGYIGIHWSLGLSAAVVFVLMISLFALVFRADKANPSIETGGLQVGAGTSGS